MVVELNPIMQFLAAVFAGPTVLMDLAIVLMWIKPAMRTPTSPEGWLIRSVFFVFLSRTFVETYIGVTWGLSLLGVQLGYDMYAWGVYFHLVFSQGLGALSAYCAIRAVVDWTRRSARG